MNKVLRDASCPIGNSCPQIEQTEGGYNVVGTNVPDPRLPEHERRVHVPASMLPELADLSIEDFNAWLADRRRSPGDVLRVQVQPAYAVPSDDEDFAGYLNGAPSPVSQYRDQWFEQLRWEADRGMTWRVLLVLDGPPTDYQRYANEWVYTYNDDAGQVIRVLNLRDHPAARVLARTGDFWAVEHEQVALVRYGADGSHRGEVQVDDTAATGYIAAAELAWSLATPFAVWYEAHPEYRRGGLPLAA